MNIIRILSEAQRGEGLGPLARALGVDQAAVSRIAAQLAPMLAGAARARLKGDDPEPVLAALEGEADARYHDDAEAAAAARADGEAFLNAMFGSGEATGKVKRRVAERAGVDLSDVLAALPALAAVAKGGMQRATPDARIATVRAARRDGGAVRRSGGLLGGLLGAFGGDAKTGGGEDPTDLLTAMFDEDGDGSAIDDILGKLLK